MPSRRQMPSQEQIDRMCEAVLKHGNKAKAAESLGIPGTTLKRWTKHLHGSPKGGGFNPVHAHKHPERILTPEQIAARRTGDLLDEQAARLQEIKSRKAAAQSATHRPGREPIAVGGGVDHAPDDAPPREVEWVEKGDSANVTFSSDRIVRTVEEALEYAQVDSSVWYVKSWKCGGWSTPIKLRQGQDANGRWRPDSGHVKQNWKVHLELARIMPKPYRDASDAIFTRIAEYAPAYPTIRRAKPDNPHLLELDLYDVHFGKLAWKAETGQDYDLRIASDVYRNAVHDLLAHASGFAIDRIVFTIGSDMFHIDSHNSTTTSGTYVDSDGRYSKIIETVEVGTVSVIEELLQVAPVKIIWIPGNHDKIAGQHLARTLAAWFRNCPEVDVDLSPKSRKYFEYGKNLLGYSHGHKEPHRSLPILMATEAPEAWARTTRRAWRIGHFHHSRRTETRSVADHDGVSVQILQSLSGKDAYHFEAGYGGRQAAEAFVLSADGLTAANFQVAARES
jgi:hypothetical protein